MRLTDISYARAVMLRHGIVPQKRYGQNFLTNPHVVDLIADVCADDECGIIEIGPGIGTLTEALCERYKKVVAIEIDKTLIPVLADTLSGFDNVKVIEGDAMKLDFNALIAEHFPGMPVAVCANLPYYITSPIIMKMLEYGPLFRSITVMIQKEVADRLTSAAGSADYGAITLAVNYRAQVEKVTNVAPSNFIPPPKVTSTVIKMNVLQKPPVDVLNEEKLFDIIKLAFAQRRKTLANALDEKYGKDDVASALEKINIRPDVRGERLSLSDFARLSDLI
ncbi:MAG: 16S rRNA (adenine(1518)-N(6)/adenine(1519)-N(6))-dimethyltransferase RsmA [Clostridia bacterium]|nr:16S rRNA (adenine(1518)-N(6)/adenine(1519)-N(6))-dimethyltransferase RsmA [Clostridia bacterium]